MIVDPEVEALDGENCDAGEESRGRDASDSARRSRVSGAGSCAPSREGLIAPDRGTAVAGVGVVDALAEGLRVRGELSRPLLRALSGGAPSVPERMSTTGTIMLLLLLVCESGRGVEPGTVLEPVLAWCDQSPSVTLAGGPTASELLDERADSEGDVEAAWEGDENEEDGKGGGAGGIPAPLAIARRGVSGEPLADDGALAEARLAAGVFSGENSGHASSLAMMLASWASGPEDTASSSASSSGVMAASRCSTSSMSWSWRCTEATLGAAGTSASGVRMTLDPCMRGSPMLFVLSPPRPSRRASTL